IEGMQAVVAFEPTFNTRYLSLPAMRRVGATEALYLEAGPQVGLLLGSKVTSGGVSADSEESNDLDFGLNIGAGYRLPMGLSIEARYNFGLANMFEDEQDANMGEVKVTNRVFSFGLGYRF